MNKLFIVLLALCLVRANAFVKRDAPAAESNPMGDIQNTIAEISKTLSQNMEKVPDLIKGKLDELGVEFQKLTQKLSGSTTSKPAAA